MLRFLMMSKLNYTERCDFLLDNLDLESASGVEGAQWEYFQLAHLCDDSTFRIENKSRQIAWSWLIAAESVANAITCAASSAFISINLDESMNKIRYARKIYESLQIGGLPSMTRDTLTELEFDNGARIVSLTSQPPRGLSRYWIYPDEFAHVQKDRQIYTAAVPIISKGGKMRIGSSPMGASGMFWEIDTQAMRPYPGYSRKMTPWWEVHAFCRDVGPARKQAPAMPTPERVDQFGNERIVAIFENVPIEDFQQEYECSYVDETTSWISWDEIKAAQVDGLQCEIATSTGTNIANAVAAIDRLAQAIKERKVEQTFCIGNDIGRTRDASEIFIVGIGQLGQYPLRCMLTLEKMEFESQLEILSYAMLHLPIVRANIDQTGIGRNLAENAHKLFGERVIGMDFTQSSKLLWATDAKTQIQKGKTPLPIHRDLAYQIHSIKRLVTASNNMTFDTDRNEKHHADKFWAWALAIAAAIRLAKIGQNRSGSISTINLG